MSERKISLKQHRFVMEYLKSGNATNAAIRAGYARKSARVTACRMLTNANIKNAIAEVNKAADDKSIADILERKRILTKIARGRMGDFVKAVAGGVVININPENINSPALKRIRYVTMPGNQAAPVNSVELRDQIAACHQLNLLAGAYPTKNGAGNHTPFVIVHESELRPNGEKPPIDIPAPKQIAERGAK